MVKFNLNHLSNVFILPCRPLPTDIRDSGGHRGERKVNEKVNNRTACSPDTLWCSAQTDTTASPQGTLGAASRTWGAVPRSTVIIETEKTSVKNELQWKKFSWHSLFLPVVFF